MDKKEIICLSCCSKILCNVECSCQIARVTTIVSKGGRKGNPLTAPMCSVSSSIRLRICGIESPLFSGKCCTSISGTLSSVRVHQTHESKVTNIVRIMDVHISARDCLKGTITE